MPTDFICDDKGEMMIKNGHFVVGESTAQHQKFLLLAQKGDYRQYPSVGVGINNFINDDDLADVGFIIQKEYELDGMKVKKLEVFSDGSVKVNAPYDSNS
jgi:hypothetical protein